MALLWLTVAVVVLVVPVGALVALLVAWRRIAALERRVTHLEDYLVAQVLAPDPHAPQPTHAPQPAPAKPEPPLESSEPTVSTPTQAPPAKPSRPFPTAPPPVALPPSEPIDDEVIPPSTHPLSGIPLERSAMWLAAALGAVSIILALLFGVSAAIDSGWIGPAVRVGTGLLVSTATALGGHVARRSGYRRLGAALVGAGVAGTLGSLYAANAVLGVLSTPLTFGLLAATSLVSMLSGVREGDRFDAVLGLLGGLATPLLVAASEPRPAVLFTYLTVVAGSGAIAGARRGWPSLVVLATLGYGALHLGWTQSAPAADAPIALAAVVSFGAALLLAARSGRKTATDAARWCLVALPLLALAWMVPQDPVFIDPTSGLTTFRPLPGGTTTAAVGLAAVVAQGLLLRDRAAQAAWALVSTALAVTFATSQANAPEVVWGAIMGGLGVLPLLAVAPKRSALARGILSLGAGLAVTATLMTAPRPPVEVALALLLGNTLLAAVPAMVSHTPALWLTGLFAATAPLLAATGLPLEDTPAALAGPAVVALAAFTALPLLWGKPAPRHTLAAALAAPALYLPLHTAWLHAGGAPIQGLLPLMLGAVSLLGATTLVRDLGARRDSTALALFVGVTLLGITAAVPLQLQDGSLTVAWALEAAALAALSRKLRAPLLRWAPVVLAIAVTVRLVANPFALEYATATGPIVFNWTLWTWGVPALALITTAKLLSLPPYGIETDGSQRAVVPPAARLLVLLGGIAVGFALVNVQVSHAFQQAGPLELRDSGVVQGMVRSLSWAGYGGLVLGVGTAGRSREVQMVGFVVLLAAAAKVFIVDLWSLSGFARMGSVAGLGITLLAAAFVFERLVLRRSRGEE